MRLPPVTTIDRLGKASYCSALQQLSGTENANDGQVRDAAADSRLPRSGSPRRAA